MSEHLTIRLAQAADETAVRACAEDAYQQYIAVIGKHLPPMEADFASLIASGFVHVAIDAQANVVGYVVFFREGDHVQLDNIAVRSNAVGRGIGKRLITFCEREAKRSGATMVKLYTNEKMSENLLMYPHLGYREIDRRTEDGFHRVFFEKRI